MKLLILLAFLPFIMERGLFLAKTELEKCELPITKDARKLAEYYRQRVLRGESMSTLAKLYSEDPGSSENGGQYDNVARGMMVPEFEKVAFSLKPGEVSEVFETQYGFHFIQLISQKGDTLSLRHILITKN